MLKKVLIPVILIGFVFFWGVGANNTLVEQEENVRQAWSQVENQYQRRADLIPNLVNTVKGAANFEQETLTAVIEARSKATSINLDASDLNSQQALDQFKQAQGQLSSALSRLMVTVERYPELKANSNLMDLQHQLEVTENRIATERMRYNQSVQSFNTDIRQFPTSFIAGVLGFEQKAYFEADEGAQEAPTVDFN